MLTDYHTHLRPDDLGHAAREVLHGGNVARYLEAAAARGIAELGFSEHVYRFRRRSTSGAIRSGRRCASTTSTSTASSC